MQSIVEWSVLDFTAVQLTLLSTQTLGIKVNYMAALTIKKDFHCSYVVDDVLEKEKWIRFCRTETQNDEDIIITTLASMLW